MLSQHEAVVVRNGVKKYGCGKPILDQLNMSVSRGSIYGLLGASGCGKTTLLSCIVGISSLDSGEIFALGGHPGSKSSSVPGPKVGFMPQEISLVKEFTLLGALHYFGRINGVKDDVIEERHIFLAELLQLPPKNRLVKHMSGGQQRRVSFACALIHEPELLILDEPTVGLDPILRENIWDFLVNLTRRKGVTVIITTHYIEETKLADKIGLLRHGKMLAEMSPNKLLAKCRCDTLEEAFLMLSQKQNDTEEERRRSQINGDIECLTELEEISHYGLDLNGNEARRQSANGYPRSPVSCYSYPVENKINNKIRWRRFQALIIKNFLQFIRHPGGILFALIFPMLQVNIFFNAIGRDPQNLSIAVVNYEAGNCHAGKYLGRVDYSEENHCEFVDISCRFLDGFQRTIAKNKFYGDINTAIDSVRHGETVGALFIGKNFSLALRERLEYLGAQEINSGDIDVTLDMGNRQIGLFIEKNIYSKFEIIYSDILEECNLPRRLMNPPLKFEKPIFGDKNQKYSTFMAPGFLLTLTFFLATSVSSSIIIADRHEGVWNRSLVQGVKTSEILISHLLTQITVIIVQVTVTTVIAFVQYSLDCRGSLAVVILLIFLMGICGMCYGFLVSVMCTSHTIANYITTGSFYPVILLCGCIWPIEGMPNVLQWISFIMPTTIPGLAIRSIIDKGHDIGNPQVYQGFLVVAGWTIILVLLCFLGMRTKKS
ncbi:ABC transporter G family member 20-like [Microplitis mediator]|uniref:ABC transporter G family member 20-like n=1 Tax=Microplitis mediator TaxID=375433 RepID=UPI002553E437|nr:ABC transporter G family member 20-like [Microplitis mediator]XP_057341036.1 ABC transporter G family member 20-like [Microplitis mediator]